MVKAPLQGVTKIVLPFPGEWIDRDPGTGGDLLDFAAVDPYFRRIT